MKEYIENLAPNEASEQCRMDTGPQMANSPYRVRPRNQSISSSESIGTYIAT